MKVTYFGHSCFMVQIGQKKILFDPYITPNPKASHIDIKELQADYIFLSHAHFDHVHDAISISQNTGATVIGNWEINGWLKKNGVNNTQPMNPGGKWRFDFGEVKCTAAVHSSSFEDGSYGGVPCGFAFKTSDGNFFYSGDTALTKDFELVNDFAKLDFAVFPIGDLLTMGVEDAIKAAKWLSVNKVLGVHYDTFELILIDRAMAIASFKNAGVHLDLPDIGASLNY